MTRVNNFYAVVVYLVFAIAVLLIGAFLLAALRGLLLLCLGVLVGFVLGRRTGLGVRTGIRPLSRQK